MTNSGDTFETWENSNPEGDWRLMRNHRNGKGARFSGPLIGCLALGLLAAAAGAQESALRPMTIDDWLDMVQVSRPLLTPDGHRVLYSRQVSNWEDNRVETTWWLSDATEGPGRPFLRTEARDVQMSPDGRLVSFIRGQDGEDQVFLMSLSGGEAWPLTEHETDIRSHEWSGDGRFIVFLAPEPRDEEDPDPDAGDDAVLVDEGPNTRTLGRWQNLWRVDVADGGSERLT
ncbi:MAG: hypothetical protein HKO53_18240, partial [Gemmatimonadetes bacterium]|nr:hypothetical protein [Gemmatimonadota bacterium]